MLDRLPVELSRHILSLAHPPPARGPSFAAALLARQRSLIACQLVCKSLKEVARDLLWERVWYRPEASSQVDHLVTTESDKGWLVRIFEYERFELGGDTPECVDPMDVVRQMPDLVELTVRGKVDVELDLGVLVGLKNLVRLSLECKRVEFVGFGDSNVTAADLVPPQLKHLVLARAYAPNHSSDHFFDTFFATCTPALRTLAVSHIEVKGEPIVPRFSQEYFLQLDVFHFTLSDYDLVKQPIHRTTTPVLATLSNYGALAICHNLREGDGPQVRRLHALARHLALPPEEIVLNVPVNKPVAPAFDLARALITAGHVKTLFLLRRLRTNGPVFPLEMLDAVHRRHAKAEEAYTTLRKACVDKGIETFFLDEEADVAAWPAWAQAEPALRGMVSRTEEQDARYASRMKAAGGRWVFLPSGAASAASA
ncbi:hypothetical protein JCM10449v2_003269 [Rhodotorula kratochvilovae]